MIARRSLYVLANSGIGALLGYVALLAMARWMGDELVGARAYALSIVFLFGLVTRLGFPTTHARELARGRDVARSTGTYLAIKTALTAAFVLLVLVAAWLWFDIMARPTTDLTTAALWTGLLIVIARSFRDVAVNTFRGLERILEREAVLLTNTLVTVIATLLVASAYAWSHGRWSPFPGVSQAAAELLGATAPIGFEQALAWLMGAYLAGDLASLALAWLLFLLQRIPIGRPDAETAATYWRATLPIMLISVSAVLLRRMDEVMLGFWHGNQEVGHYAAAARLSALVLLAAMAVKIVLMPAISRLQASGDIEAIRLALARSERWLGLLVIPVLLFAFTATDAIIHILLSDAFLPAATMLVILLAQAYLATMTAPLRAKALGLGEHGVAARVALEAVAINLLLNSILIPDGLAGIRLAGLGGEGAAIATLAAGLWFLLRYRRLAKAWTGHPLLAQSLRMQLVVAAVLFLPLLWLVGWLPLARFYHLAAYGILVLGMWVAAMVATGGLDREDVRFVRRVLGGRP